MESRVCKPRGTKDLFGSELDKLNYLKELIIEEFKLNGFKEIQTPIFEYEEVFLKNDSDCLGVNKEFFYIDNKKDHRYVLRPENTASVARAVVENNLLNNSSFLLKYYYCGPFFRYDRPQKGRYRQFTQIGFEKLNTRSFYEDLDNIRILERIFKKLEISLKLHINFLGNKNSKRRWSLYLSEYFSNYKDKLSETSQKRAASNPIRILDDEEDSSKDFVKQVLPIDSFFETEEERFEMEACIGFLKNMEVDYVWDKNLVRGIDYYTGLIYEWKDSSTGLTIAAGGRYDEVFDRFQQTSISATGIAIGLDRLSLLFNKEITFLEKHRQIYIVLLTDPDKALFKFLNILQDFHISISIDFSTKELKKHFKSASRMGIDRFIIYGEKEKSNGVVSIKISDLQKEFSMSNTLEIIDFLKK